MYTLTYIHTYIHMHTNNIPHIHALAFSPSLPFFPPQPCAATVPILLDWHHPHHRPRRLCCPHAVERNARRYVVLQPLCCPPPRACLAGSWASPALAPPLRSLSPPPPPPPSLSSTRPANPRCAGYRSSDECGYCKDAANSRASCPSLPFPSPHPHPVSTVVACT